MLMARSFGRIKDPAESAVAVPDRPTPAPQGSNETGPHNLPATRPEDLDEGQAQDPWLEAQTWVDPARLALTPEPGWNPSPHPFGDEETVQVSLEMLLKTGPAAPPEIWESAHGRALDFEPPTLQMTALDTESTQGTVLSCASDTAEVFVDPDRAFTPSVRRKFEGPLRVANKADGERLTAIMEMSQTIHSERSLPVILDSVARTITAISGGDRCAVLLRDPETEQLFPAAIHTSNQAGDDREFRISRGIIQDPLRHGISVISSDAAEDDRYRRRDSVLLEQVHSVMCSPLQTRNKIIGVIYVDSVSYAEVFDEVDLALLASIGQQAGTAVERARLVDDLENLFVGAMLAITASIEAKDSYTRGHSERVTIYALMLADKLGLGSTDRDVIELGALLHDVGKIGIPESVLLKPGALNDEEFALMKRHPSLGAAIISNMPELDRIVPMGRVIDAVRYHHEKLDGSGYPGALFGQQIPLAARILAIADCFDALITDRPYRAGLPRASALSIMRRDAGSHFDPLLVEHFCALLASGSAPGPHITKGRFRINRSGVFGVADPSA